MKVVIIGGGLSYILELVEGFIKWYDEFLIWELWFVDVEEGKEKFEIVGVFVKRMVKKVGVDMKIYLMFDW